MIGAKRPGHHAHRVKPDLHVFASCGFRDRLLKPLVVRHRVLERRFRHRDDNAAVGMGDPEINAAHLLFQFFENPDLLFIRKIRRFDPAPVSRRDIRHKHHHVTVREAGGAGKPPSVLVFLVAQVTCLYAVEFAAEEFHAAFPAGSVAAAGRVDCDVRSLRHFQQIAAPAG